MSDIKYIECGKIINTHGCRGGIKAESWCNTEDDLASLKRLFIKNNSEYEEYKIKKASIFKQFVIFEFKGLEDMDQAMLLKNKTLYARRDDFKLSDGEYFLADMIGLSVIDADSGVVYGKLTQIINRGASDIYVVATERGERMIPAVDEFIISVDIKNGVFIRPIEGMLD
jgi:16S rRNA processing protein RimM